jgi:uncharacterized protein (UPF0548 family)
MLSPTRPTEVQLRDLLARSRELPLSYAEVGATAGTPPVGFVRDHHRVRLGQGPRAFDRACAALRGWAMFDLGWIGVWPPGIPIEKGAVVAVVAHGFGAWAAFTCRIVRAWEEHGPVESLGFAYGTLPGHLLVGEDRFEVGWDLRDGSVWYDVVADSRPAGLLGRAAHPLIRRVQRRFAPDSLRSMVRATGVGE